LKQIKLEGRWDSAYLIVTPKGLLELSYTDNLGYKLTSGYKLDLDSVDELIKGLLVLKTMAEKEKIKEARAEERRERAELARLQKKYPKRTQE